MKKCSYCKNDMPQSYGTTVEEKKWEWRSDRGRGLAYCSYSCMKWAQYHFKVARITNTAFKKGCSPSEAALIMQKAHEDGTVVRPLSPDPRETTINKEAEAVENIEQAVEIVEPVKPAKEAGPARAGKMKRITKLEGEVVSCEVQGRIVDNLIIDDVDNGAISRETLVKVIEELTEVLMEIDGGKL